MDVMTTILLNMQCSVVQFAQISSKSLSHKLYGPSTAIFIRFIEVVSDSFL